MAQSGPQLHLTPLDITQLPGWQREDFPTLLQIFREDCAKTKSRPQLAAACAVAEKTDPHQAEDFFKRNFKAMRAEYQGTGGQALFTGYYEPVLKGSLKKSDRYAYPLYKVPGPEHLQRTRQEIDAGALSGLGLEIVWLDDPVARFALHIQGSGRIDLEDGGVMRVGYAGRNNHEYYSIGKAFEEQGILPRGGIDMPKMESWLYANPARQNDIFAANPSYIFFAERKGSGAGTGPIGSMSRPLVPGRSIAVDKSHWPLGTILWADLPHPDGASGNIQRALFAHDTGSAIKGALRGDYFWGAGDRAKKMAGLMISRGALYAILPKDDPLLAQLRE